MQDKLEKLRKEKEKKIQELKNEMKNINDRRKTSSKSAKGEETSKNSVSQNKPS